MKTEVIMKRQLFEGTISQKSKSEFMSATDLQLLANQWRAKNGLNLLSLNRYFKLDSTNEFMEALQSKYGNIKTGERGRSKHTWVHPILFIDIALYFSPTLKVEVYEWLYDYLIKYRNDSGDSYKKMAGAIYVILNNKSEYQLKIKDTANKIKIALKVNDWNSATERQLELRDKIHNNISLLSNVLRDLNQVIDISINEAFKDN